MDNNETERLGESISGQVVRIRRLSKSVRLFEILPTCALRKRNVFMKDPELVMQASSGKYKLHPGDEVTLQGCIDSDAEFAVSRYDIHTLWSTRSPLTTFKPTFSQVAEELEDNSCRTACKYFVKGKCFRENCQFLHDLESLKSERSTFRQERRNGKLLNHDSGFGKDGCPKDHSHRASVFCDWLIARFGLAYLRSGTILDIAGGRGDLSFQLRRRDDQLTCIVVDPRDCQPTKWQRKWQKQHADFQPPIHVQDKFDDEFFQRSSVHARDVRLVVGLHPDEATEPLVDVALSHDLSFAVVPCCVFSHLFPDRRRLDGTRPIAYDEFCAYLTEKCERIETETLSFIGRNMVLFRR